MFPLYPTPRPTTPTTTPTPALSSTTLPATGPALAHIYSALLRPTLLPPPAAFTQPLLDSFVANHDPLLEDTTLFTAGTRLREVSVEVERVEREWRRLGVTELVDGGAGAGAGAGVSLSEVREGRLRCRLANQAAGTDRTRKERLKERMEAFEKEMKKEEEEALKAFKEGLRRAVGG
ncbi:uncharacterized protein LAJ45_06969 [Morchella importuna]|uniref:Uncharacterized protein n=1 Tax=Morchella conica CCBAS932 TaxID=1392247 RepID=A0A3N4KTU7_9PEZI|nr:uncharacterized protein LAJ45_06969 [Morchella importuna]KAH8148994.1 hypothetical protein LAJ45_06969 [Morchella importuna]RPB12839.1 hypothetical protein P167DRAFT_605432 [Morchella conica CCBAS932]